MHCFFCGEVVEVVDRIGRLDRCSHCGRDLHICKNCHFYDEKTYNECREPQAERVVDKEASNFCDYFEPGEEIKGGASKADALGDAKKKLEGLFKK